MLPLHLPMSSTVHFLSINLKINLFIARGDKFIVLLVFKVKLESNLHARYIVLPH